MRCDLVDDIYRLSRWQDEWDQPGSPVLGRPFCAPAWMLAWWQHASPRILR